MKPTDFLESAVYRRALRQYFMLLGFRDFDSDGSEKENRFSVSLSGYSMHFHGTWQEALKFQRTFQKDADFGYDAYAWKKDETLLWLPGKSDDDKEINFLSRYMRPTDSTVAALSGYVFRPEVEEAQNVLLREKTVRVEADSALFFVPGVIVVSNTKGLWATSTKNATEEELFIYLSHFWGTRGGKLMQSRFTDS